jgi:hypothetical protein
VHRAACFCSPSVDTSSSYTQGTFLSAPAAPQISPNRLTQPVWRAQRSITSTTSPRANAMTGLPNDHFHECCVLICYRWCLRSSSASPSTPSTTAMGSTFSDPVFSSFGTAPTVAGLSVVPPVTPSKHVAVASARASAAVPPGQPRKTPNAKRVAGSEREVLHCQASRQAHRRARSQRGIMQVSRPSSIVIDFAFRYIVLYIDQQNIYIGTIPRPGKPAR